MNRSQVNYKTKNRIKVSRGFSLVELSIAIAILAIMASVFSPLISQGIDAIINVRTSEQLTYEANQAMNFMTEVLRFHCVNFSSNGDTAFQFPDENGNLRWFRINSANHTLEYGDDRSGAFLIYPLARNMIAGGFRYLPAVTTAISTAYDFGYSPASNNCTRVIQIDFTLQDPVTAITYRAVTRVYLLRRDPSITCP